MGDAVYTKKRAPRSKWKEVLEVVLQEFSDGKFTDGMQFYTLEHLCVIFGVSDITGRRVFSELKARGLVTSKGRRGTIVTGNVVTQEVFMCLPNVYFDASVGGITRYHSATKLFEGFNSGDHSRHFRVLPISLGFLLDNIANFSGKPVIVTAEALVDFSPQPSVLNIELLDKLREAVNPVVFDSFGDLPNITQVGVNFYQGIRKVVHHLVSRGHTRIGYFSGEVNDFWLRPRFKGFVDGLFAEGIQFDPSLILVTPNLERDVNLEALDEFLNNPQRPTAVICANDRRAIFVLEYCRASGLSVPDEIAVTGFDNTPEASLVWAPLTTVDGMETQIGSSTLELLFARQSGKLKEPVQVQVEPELIIRVSG